MMDFAHRQRNPARHLLGMAIVALAHALGGYALVMGLSQRVVEIARLPLETDLIVESMQPQHPPPPPAHPPPQLAHPAPQQTMLPLPFVPPVEVNISVAEPFANTITQVTSNRPAASSEPTAARHVERTPPVIDAKRNCAMPEYPPASRRLEETGTVMLRFLIDAEGFVVESRIESSSGYERLDEAARHALGKCRFKPGMVDGKPEQSWASIKYTWQLQ